MVLCLIVLCVLWVIKGTWSLVEPIIPLSAIYYYFVVCLWVDVIEDAITLWDLFIVDLPLIEVTTFQVYLPVEIGRSILINIIELSLNNALLILLLIIWFFLWAIDRFGSLIQNIQWILNPQCHRLPIINLSLLIPVRVNRTKRG